jgi:4-hydroxy-tetrahydrodipicolinate reductase
MRYALVGHGRMGHAIATEAARRGHEQVARLDSEDALRLTDGTLTAADLGDAEVVFEFTIPAAARHNVLTLTGLGIPVVCGTTGWELDRESRKALGDAPAGAVIGANFSLGMRLFTRIVGEASRLFAAADSHRASIFESHHTGKRDAPSGTARELSRILLDTDPRLRSVHEGNTDGTLPAGALHVVSLRVESEPGTHTVSFDGEYDRVALTHRARGRAGFAAGAVLAGEWIRGRTGLYEFDQVVEDLLSTGGR